MKKRCWWWPIPVITVLLGGVLEAFEIPSPGDLEGNITRLEYYIDDDPGQGQGVAVDFQLDGTGRLSLELQPVISGLPTGAHTLFVRCQNGRGDWSQLASHRFFISAFVSREDGRKLVRAEYFLGSDPGNGNGVSVDLNSDPKQVVDRLQFGASQLGQGKGSIGFRAQDTLGHWSLTKWKRFFITPFSTSSAPTVTAAEYFIGEDPGPGMGRPLEVGDEISFGADDQAVLDQLGFGSHSIGIRLQDEVGHWSQAATRRVFRMPRLPATAIEWSLNEGGRLLERGLHAIDPPREQFATTVDTGVQAESDLVGKSLTLEARLVILEKIPGRAAYYDFEIEGIVDPLIFLSQPMSVSVREGEPIVLAVEVSGTPPYSYQWEKDGVVLVTTTGRQLNVVAATIADAGLYTVTARDAFGEITSDVVRVVVEAAPPLVVGNPHPADRNQDWQLSMTEVTAYGAAWRRNEVWPIEPNPIPISYVTRAGALWKTGEDYEVDPSIDSPPLWWVSSVGGLQRNRLLEAGEAKIRVRRQRSAGQMSITIEPDPGVFAYAFEEVFSQPVNLVSGVHEGGLVGDGRRLRWGPFSDGQSRVLTYRLESEADGIEKPSHFGIVSYNGNVVRVPSEPNGGSPLVSKPSIEFDAERGVLRLTRVYSRYVEIQSANQLSEEAWTTLETFVAGEDVVEWNDSEYGSTPIRFYRVLLGGSSELGQLPR